MQNGTPLSHPFRMFQEIERKKKHKLTRKTNPTVEFDSTLIVYNSIVMLLRHETKDDTMP